MTIRTALDVATSLAVIAAAAVLVWVLTTRNAPISQPQWQIENVDRLRLSATQITHVEGTGPIALVEFSDFECPFCRAFVKETYPKIKRRLVDTGTVRFVSLHYPLEKIHPHAVRAAEATECAGQQGHFWRMRSEFFDDPTLLQQKDLAQRVRLSDLDWTVFQRCLDQGERKDKVRADYEEGLRLGVRGTPTFFVGAVQPDGSIDLLKRINGIASFEALAREVAAVAGAS